MFIQQFNKAKKSSLHQQLSNCMTEYILPVIQWNTKNTFIENSSSAFLYWKICNPMNID